MKHGRFLFPELLLAAMEMIQSLRVGRRIKLLAAKEMRMSWMEAGAMIPISTISVMGMILSAIFPAMMC